MKQLRILTGQHAGAQLPLTRRSYRIASDEEADLQISDWDQAPLILSCVEEGSDMSPALHLIGDDGLPQGEVARLADFVPRRFGDVVLCAGPAEATWPKDVDLMAALMRPAEAVVAAVVERPRWMGLKFGALVLGAVLLVGFVSVLSLQTNATANAVPPPSPSERVHQALRQTGVSGLSVRAVDRRLVVEGLLNSTAEMARVRTALQPFGEDLLLHRYAAATDVVRQIADALGRPGLRVTHRGAGVFAVDGQDLDPAQVRVEAARIAADVGPLVARLEVDVAERLPASRVRVGAMLGGDELQYVQTADGTKHLSLVTPVEEGEAAVPAAASSTTVAIAPHPAASATAAGPATGTAIAPSPSGHRGNPGVRAHPGEL